MTMKTSLLKSGAEDYTLSEGKSRLWPTENNKIFVVKTDKIRNTVFFAKLNSTKYLCVACSLTRHFGRIDSFTIFVLLLRFFIRFEREENTAEYSKVSI